jgi:hypothetical protein
MSGSPGPAREPYGGRTQVIGKPFTAKDLLEKVRAVLDAMPCRRGRLGFRRMLMGSS